jgi:hypothetical protein
MLAFRWAVPTSLSLSGMDDTHGLGNDVKWYYMMDGWMVLSLAFGVIRGGVDSCKHDTRSDEHARSPTIRYLGLYGLH